jgi:hypothetical protein
MSAVGLSMPISMPGLGSMIPSLTGGTAGPATGSANNGISLPLSTPTNIDGSGWVVNMGDGNSTKAGGNQGANTTSQTATPTAQGGASGAAGSGEPNGQQYMLPTAGQVSYGSAPMGGGLNMMVLVLGAIGAVLLLK